MIYKLAGKKNATVRLERVDQRADVLFKCKFYTDMTTWTKKKLGSKYYYATPNYVDVFKKKIGSFFNLCIFKFFTFLCQFSKIQ